MLNQPEARTLTRELLPAYVKGLRMRFFAGFDHTRKRYGGNSELRFAQLW